MGDADVDAAVRGGAAVFNAGHHHAAHDAWEDPWLGLDPGTADERLLHALIQCAAAVHHGERGNWDAVASLAASADGYLDGLPDGHRGVDVPAVRAFLGSLAADPIRLERAGAPPLTVGGERLVPADLDLHAALAAAPALAEGVGLAEAPVETAVDYARTDLAAGDEGSQFVTLVWDFVREGDRRPLIHRRLEEHVERRRTREEDVSGLF